MAQEPIWAGSSSFASGNTPWGFYDADTEFISSVDKFADWSARRLQHVGPLRRILRPHPPLSAKLQARPYSPPHPRRSSAFHPPWRS